MKISHKIRIELIDNLNYVRLVSLLLPGNSGGGIYNPHVQVAYNAAIEFVNQASEQDFIFRGPVVLNVLQGMVDEMRRLAPPRKDLSDISSAFTDLMKRSSEVLSYGIPFHWLEEFLDTSTLIDSDIPFHARIGTGHHAGKWAVEEMFLLGDGFYFLVSAQLELKRLFRLGSELNRTKKQGYPSESGYYEARDINLNVCTYARNSIVNLYSFLECFVNSVGYDFYLRNISTVNKPSQEQLLGKRNGRYLSLEKKLTLLPAIISGSSGNTISLSQKFNDAKEIRDAAMHYSPIKSPIWLRPPDWVKKAEEFSEAVLPVAREFWLACYGSRPFPFYLSDLDYDKCLEAAKKRLETTRAVHERIGPETD